MSMLTDGTVGSCPTDAELWDRLRRHDPEALGDLFVRYRREVHAFAVRRTGSYAVADDAVQSTFVTAWKQFGRGDPGPLSGITARAWLLTIAMNELRNVTRARRRLSRFVSRQPGPSSQPDHADAVAARVDSERQIREVRRAIAKLPRHQREVVELVYWAQLGTSEAAAVLGIAPGTVKSRLSRAHRRLPDLLEHPQSEDSR